MREWNEEDFRNLHQAGRFLSKENKKTLGLLMPVDVYVQDPQVAERDEALALKEIWIGCEPELMAGPTSARIAVVDRDGDTNVVEDPVQWDRRTRCFFVELDGERVPVTRAHQDLPQFHQVNVWAIVQSILDMYEATWVLGRSAPWAFQGNRLTVVPHAGRRKNAFYSRADRSLLFYYFDAGARRVYTCLSHDVIAHETGHAILDGLRPYYFESSSVQTAAFHEFVADLTAIMISLLNNSLRWEVARVAKGDLSEDTIIAALAEEFGHYATGRSHLRSATNTKTVDDVQSTTSPYPWSEVMTGAMWDILSGMFAKYRAKPKKSTGKPPSDKEALLWAVNRFRRLAFQPLDFLPPADVQFGDYARAVLRADELVDPVDKDGYRGLMRSVFDRRGIDYAEEEDETERLYFYAYDIDRLSRSRTDAYHFLHENRRQLCIPADQDVAVVDLYHTDKTLRNGGRLPREIVLQYAWREAVPLKGAEYRRLNGETMSMMCGGTLIFDERGNVLHWVRKPGSGAQTVSSGRRRTYCGPERAKGQQRRREFLEYMARRARLGLIGLADEAGPQEMDGMPPMMARRAQDGTLRLETAPHLRHWSEE